jgi:hypothetical protein
MAITTAYEQMLISSVGQLPRPGDRLPTIKLRQRSARVLRSAFYWRGSVPEVGSIIEGDWDLIRGLAKRRLVEECAL